MTSHIPSPQGPVTGDLAPDRRRDRSATQQRILEAAQAILTEEGPSGFGVNAVARASGVDKQLIYRYFGGLDGLLSALGERIATWWQEKLLQGPSPTPMASYGALIEALALRVLYVMRTEPLAVQCALWELADNTQPVKALAAARGRALGAWMARAKGDLQPPDGVDAPAVNAMIISALSYMVLASRNAPTVIGLATDDEATWIRIETALRALIQGVYGAQAR